MAGARGTHRKSGSGRCGWSSSRRGARLAVGGDPVDCGEDGLHDGDAAQVGAAGRERQRRCRGVTSDERERLKELERENRRAAPRERDPAQGVGVFRPGGARPPTEVMVAFIDEHREAYGVEPICASSCRSPRRRTTSARRASADPARRPARAQRDAELRAEIRARLGRELPRLRGAEGVAAAPARRHRGGALHGRAADAARWGCAARFAAGVQDDDPRRCSPSARSISCSDEFTRDRPNQLWVADLTYVATWRGFVYVAFVIDVFSRRIVGWRVSSSLRSDLALDALEQALHDRAGRRRAGSSQRSRRRSTCRSATPSAWPRPASSRRSAASAIRTTTRSPRRSSASSRPR